MNKKLLIVLLNTLALSANAVYRVSDTYVGNNWNNTFNGTSDAIYYGLKGHDRFNSTSGADEQIFVGGIGNDRYYTANNSIMTIADGGNGGYDVIYGSTFSFLSRNSHAATYDGRHLVGADFNTGTVVIILDWKSKANAIEEYRFSDVTVSHSYLTRNITRRPNYWGNLSQRTFAGNGILLPSARDIANANSYYQKLGQTLQRRAGFNEGLDAIFLDNNTLEKFSFSDKTNKFSYDLNPIRNDALDSSMFLYSQNKMNPYQLIANNNSFSYSKLINNNIRFDYAYSKTNYESNFADSLANENKDLLNETGYKFSYSLNKDLEINYGYKLTSDSQGFIGTSKILGLNLLQDSKSKISQLGLSFNPYDNLKITASYSYGEAMLNTISNPFVNVDKNIDLKSYAVEVQKDKILTKQDKLIIGFNVPMHSDSAKATYLLPKLFGEQVQNINMFRNHQINYGLSYFNQLQNNTGFYGLTMHYKVNDYLPNEVQGFFNFQKNF